MVEEMLGEQLAGLQLAGTAISLPVRNQGRGPAMDVRVTYVTEHPSAFPHVLASPIAPMEYHRFEWQTGPAAAFPRIMTGRIDYSDIGGVAYRTEFEITHHGLRPTRAAVRYQHVERVVRPWPERRRVAYEVSRDRNVHTSVHTSDDKQAD